MFALQVCIRHGGIHWARVAHYEELIINATETRCLRQVFEPSGYDCHSLLGEYGVRFSHSGV